MRDDVRLQVADRLMENGDDVQLQVADRLMENGDAISLSQTCVAPFLPPWQRKQEVTKSSNPECYMQCQSVKHEALPWRCHDFCHVSVSADFFLCHVSVMSSELGLQPIFKLHHELPWIFRPRTGHCNLNSYLEGCHVPVWSAMAARARTRLHDTSFNPVHSTKHHHTFCNHSSKKKENNCGPQAPP